MTLKVIILAAGQGKRMHSALPKVLHRLAGKPLLEHIITTAQALKPTSIYLVYGHAGEQIRDYFQQAPVTWVKQTEQLGTGHAVAQVLPLLDDTERVLVLFGDTPLVMLKTLQQLQLETPLNGLGLVIDVPIDPTGLGRLCRNAQGNITALIEHKDASAEQRQIAEVWSGILITTAKNLRTWLAVVDNNNIQQEYYLTQIVKLAYAAHCPIYALKASCSEEVQGVNDCAQLALLERYYQRRLADQLMQSGVTIMDPSRLDIRGNVSIAADVTLDINVIMEGKVSLGRNSYIGPQTYLRNVSVGENVHVKANSVIEEATIDAHCVIGPFARIRPGTHLAHGVQIGNFVEIKNTQVDTETKINHLSYVGDANVGKRVNIGAGTITANYDGLNKHRTVIADDASIGADTQLIAPVTVGKGATIGAGSTITKEAPAYALTLTRVQQHSIPGWRRPVPKSDK